MDLEDSAENVMCRTDRCYDEAYKSPMPQELQYLSKLFAMCCDGVNSFIAQASIINYYNTKSQMGGKTLLLSFGLFISSNSNPPNL